MILWVDADACPREAREIILKALRRTKIKCIFVANRHQNLPAIQGLQQVIVEPGHDKADQYIISTLTEADLVLSNDIPLAAQAIEKGSLTLTFFGLELDKNNIAFYLGRRNASEKARADGWVTGGPKPWSDKTKKDFGDSLNTLLSRKQRAVR